MRATVMAHAIAIPVVASFDNLDLGIGPVELVVDPGDPTAIFVAIGTWNVICCSTSSSRIFHDVEIT